MTATLTERICARIVWQLGERIEVLNHVPFGLDIVAKYRAYAVRNSYLNREKLEQAHRTEATPPRNVRFCEFIIESLEQSLVSGECISLLEVGAGRSINANIIHMLRSDGIGGRAIQFTLIDKFVDPALFVDQSFSFRARMVDAADCDLASLGPFDLGMTRATLSLMPAAAAKRVVTAMARACSTVVLNEVVTDAPLSRTIVRADKHMIHPFQKWLRDLGRDPRTIDWAVVDRTYNAIIVA